MSRTFLARAALAAILGLIAVAVPTSSVHSADGVLVATPRAKALDTDPDVVWILAVGSDARPGEEPTRTRGDALHLIAIDTRTGAASDVGIPRDSYVSIPGHGSDRINAALYYGGPELIAETVGEMFGVHIDYTFVTSFGSFKTMIDGVGGVVVDNPRFFSDSKIKAQGFAEGEILLRGYTALAFSRIRKSLPRGDFDRTANQTLVLKGIQARIHERAAERGWMDRKILLLMESLATNASPAELYRLSRAVATLRPRLFTTCVLFGDLATINGASVVAPYLGDAKSYGDQARDDATIEDC